MPIYSCSHHCSTDVLMALLPVVCALWILTEGWRTSLKIKFVLGELTCQSILVLVTVETVSRCRDGFAPGCALSGF